MNEHAYKLLKKSERVPMTKICFTLCIENQIGYIVETNIHEKKKCKLFLLFCLNQNQENLKRKATHQ